MVYPTNIPYLKATKDDSSEESQLIQYLKSLMPSAIDLEFRALCLGEDDQEGIDLLEDLLIWFSTEFARGDNFEILQAYLSRTLTIYNEIILKNNQLGGVLTKLKESHQISSNRFNKTVESNLAVLNFLMNLPLI